jgi:hypothetical protein
MITQTWAMFVDAYRELCAKRLFWLVLLLSFAIAAVFAAIGINENGITVLVWELPIPIFSTQVMNRETFYKLVFANFGFKIWLTWAATILALISTAAIIPDFVSGGSVELSLSKPIGRMRLFLTKYLTGLLFVALQVSAFSVTAFLVIAWRGEALVWKIFLGIPLVILFFSYLFCVSALIGLLTRSAVAAVLGTAVVWFVIFVVHFGDNMLLMARVYTELEAHDAAAAVERLEAGESAADIDRRYGRRRGMFDQPQRLVLDSPRAVQDWETDARRQHQRWSRVHTAAYSLKTVLPKTSETMDLLERWMIDWGELEGLRGMAQNQQREQGGRVQREMEQRLRARSPTWIIGSSLMFEVMVLVLGAWYFSRKDF